MEERSRRSRGTKPQKASATMNVSVPYSLILLTHLAIVVDVVVVAVLG
jgi:hypothetical protein